MRWEVLCRKNWTAVENLEECEMVVRQSLGEIEEAAAETIAENGYDYDVTAELEHTSFPVKNYGSYTFPAGDYEALRIVIGEGNGHNWWCVMYPNMCFQTVCMRWSIRKQEKSCVKY